MIFINRVVCIRGVVVKKRTYFIFAGVLFLLFFSAISYGFWKSEFLQENLSLGSTPCLTLSFEEKNEGIQLLEAFPISDEEGKKLSPYIFKITNTCNNLASYQVNLENMLHDQKELPLSYVKVELNQNTPNILNHHKMVEPYLENAKEAYKLTTGTLKEHESVTYELRLWLDENTPATSEVSEASFLSKISIVATPDKIENLFNDIEISVELGNFLEEEQKQLVYVNATSTNYNLVSYAFSNTLKSAEELKYISWNTIIPESMNHQVLCEYTDNGTYYVYYKNAKGNIKEQEIVIDTFDRTGPEIIHINSLEEWVLEHTITVIAKDERSGIVGYAFTTSEAEPFEYTFVDGGSDEKTFTYSVHENGTYYIWLKDRIGNTSHKEIVIDKIDRSIPSSSYHVDRSTLGNHGWYQMLRMRVELSDSESGVVSSKYCITTSSECVPNKEASIENNHYIITFGSSSKPQRICSVVTDAVGNESNVSCDELSYFVDSKKPLIANVSGGVMTQGSNGWWTELSLIVTGRDSVSGLISSKYCFTSESSCVPNTNASLNGDNVTINYQSSVSAQRFCITFTDYAGNESDVWCDPTSYFVDVNQPIANIRAVSNQNNIVIDAGASYDAHSQISKYYYSKDNSNWFHSTSSTFTFTDYADGLHTVYLKVEDHSGRISNVVSASVCIAYHSVYISHNGNDSSCGSITQPLQTLHQGYQKVKNDGNIILLDDIVVSTQTNFDSSNKTVHLRSNNGQQRRLIRDSYLKNPLLSISNGNKVDVTNIIFDGAQVLSHSSLLSVAGDNTWFTFDEGSIIANAINTTEYSGGGINVISGAHFLMNAGVIQNNKSVNQGAGVYVGHGEFILQGGIIMENELTNGGSGGGVFLYYSTLDMNSGYISSNKAGTGAGVNADHSTIYYDGGSITGNIASGRGGGIDLVNSSNMWATNLNISGNTAGTYGGGISIRSNSKFWMYSGSITSNRAAKAGGGVDGSPAGTLFDMRGGTISGNSCSTSNCGGGVSLYQSDYSNTGCSIQGNTPKDFTRGT